MFNKILMKKNKKYFYNGLKFKICAKFFFVRWRFWVNILIKSIV